MVINIVIGSVLVGYIVWTLYRFFKKSAQGKCAGCAIKDSCKAKCD
ncbi:hypothetical protein Pryu01_01494 [Paraliobacillus ryukyuensis]|uniref:Attachment p12 family protein n=1 Tax=Paraliobacillus ryukyuensis TaxID=200904 RepID=A0A366EBX9_9BACI|nr:FeoB-associated Cys-rich membrane protein [Paraliobacillus ryukyuensis]RBO99837.1 attachment p12 family protein [Paraliobacillus ryukyuensis]